MGIKTEKIKINEIWKIKQDVEDLGKKLSSQLTTKAEENMVSAFKSIIKDFYRYNPKKYKRKNGGELDDALVNHHTYGYSDNKYKATIKIGSNNMSNSYRISPDNILDLMWTQGIRGLPRQGSSALGKKFTWYTPIGTKTWYPGEVWVNPFWSGEAEPYNNIFKTTVDIDGYETPAKMAPHFVMIDFIHKWGNIGKNECDKIVKEII